jgi:pimeloyl-ACP methyl ester carboxylesterase
MRARSPLADHCAANGLWRAWERRLNSFHHFTWEGIHFVYHRAASGGGVPLILTHGWPGSFLDYLEMLPLLDRFDVVVPSPPGYGFSPRPPTVGINYPRSLHSIIPSR